MASDTSWRWDKLSFALRVLYIRSWQAAAVPQPSNAEVLKSAILPIWSNYLSLTADCTIYIGYNRKWSITLDRYITISSVLFALRHRIANRQRLHSFGLSWNTAKVIGRFRWNLVLWLSLPIVRTSPPSRIWIPDDFSTYLTIDWRRRGSESATFWERSSADIRIRIRIKQEIRIRILDRWHVGLGGALRCRSTV